MDKETSSNTVMRQYDTVLGFDFGERHIGLALANQRRGLVQPLGHLKATKGKPNWQQLGKIIDQWQPVAMVVGLPLHADGTDSRVSKLAKIFADELVEKFLLDCFLQNEYLTSNAAKHETDDPMLRHAIAARHILQSWLGQRTLALEGAAIRDLSFEIVHFNDE